MVEHKRVMKNFSQEEEELLRAFIFTNPHGRTGFVYPQELVAGEELPPLISAYSRTHISLQDRILTFIDLQKDEQARAMLPHIKPLMNIFRMPNGTLRVSKRTTDFTNDYVLGHGHNSIKEEEGLFAHVEEISDIAVKGITGHPLNRPQVKSSRYLSFGDTLDLSLQDPDLLSLDNADEVISYVKWMNQRYLESTEKLTTLVLDDSLNLEYLAYLGSEQVIGDQVEEILMEKPGSDPDEVRAKIIASLSPERVRANVSKFILDYSRVYLLAVSRTSLGFSADARTLESIITGMISSPRIEDRERGQELWDEAKKVSPILMGERSHIKIDHWKVKNEIEFRQYLQDRFGDAQITRERVRLITPKNVDMCSDRWNASQVVFPYVDLPIEFIYAILSSEKEVKDILERAHEYRGDRDLVHPAICHGGLPHEITIGYHAYRDWFRHRNGSRSVQLLTTRLGFEVPEIFKHFGIDGEYLNDMEDCRAIFESVRRQSPHKAEKVVPFGALCRALHSWQVNQDAYVAQLRGDIAKGNESYVMAARELADKISRIMPITGSFFKVDRREYPSQLWKKGYGWYDNNKREK